MLLIGFAGGFRRSELVGLHHDDVEPTPEEIAFYVALAENESAVEVMGSEQLRVIAHQLVEEMRAYGYPRP